MRVTKENTIGLIVDLQERLIAAMDEKEKLQNNCGILIKGLREMKVPLLFSQQYTKGLGETIPEIRNLVDDFSYFEKKDFSCCDVPEMAEELERTGVENIIICGIESHVCVLQSAIDFKDVGLNPIVVTDCVSSRKKSDIEIAKERFRYEEIMMASYESILFELTRSAGNSAFRAISKLVK